MSTTETDIRRRVIGIAGRNACGKGTAAEFFLRHPDSASFRYSTKLGAALRLFRIPETRQNLQDISTLLRGRWGEDLLARDMLQDCLESPKRRLIIEGIRRPADVHLARELFGADYTLLWIEAPAGMRFARMRVRNEKAGESAMDWETFLEREQAETERLLDEIQTMADVRIDNDGTREEFLKRLGSIETNDPGV